MTDNVFRILGKGVLAYGAFTLIKNELVSKFSFGIPKVNTFKYPFTYKANDGTVKTSYTMASLNFAMEITNNSFLGATLSGVTGQIKYGEYVLAQIVVNKKTVIKSHSKATIGGILVLDFVQLVNNGLTMVSEKDFLNKLEVDLIIKTPDANINYASPIQLV